MEMLPVLEAEEVFKMKTAVGLGTGSFDEQSQRQIHNDLKRQLNKFEKPARIDPAVREAQLGMLGIPVKRKK